MKPYLLISGDFAKTGGMDRANYALADYLAREGHEVHLVAHRVDEELLGRKNVVFHRAARPGGSHLLGAPMLRRLGRVWAKKIEAAGGRVLANGGNYVSRDANWVHYVHAAWTPQTAGGWSALRQRVQHRLYLSQERQALRAARVIIANSQRTKRDLMERVGIEAVRIYPVYLGVDAEAFAPATAQQREETRLKMGWEMDRPVVAFVGALSDRRKGFDTVFEAWKMLCGEGKWEARLEVIGAGRELPLWQQRAQGAGMRNVEFLGYRSDVAAILRACDAMVAPSRYEAYGMAAAEAICCGLSAFVSADCGVAERYPRELHGLLLGNANDPVELAGRLRQWQAEGCGNAAALAQFSEALRKDTWDTMARRMVEIIESAGSD